MLARLRRRLRPRLLAVLGLAGLALAMWGLARAVDPDELAAAGRAMADDPVALLVAVSAFGAAFVLRAALWTRVLPGLDLGQAVAGVHLATGANHVLPFRLGEPLRVVSVVKRTEVPAAVATSSTLALRSADIVAVAALGWLVAPSTFDDMIGPWGWAAFAAVTATGIAGVVWLRRDADRARVRLPGLTIAAGSMLAWALEAVLVWQCARFAGIELSPGHAVLVTAAAVSAQVVAITPGGIGTYEAASVAAYSTLGYDPATALVAAVATHAVKTLYTLGVGAVALFVPSPGLAGRLRVHPARPLPPRPVRDPGPVVLFLPAHDEQATVAEVVSRAPAQVHGHPVRCVVVDDGSRDDTAGRARAAGATVLSSESNHGLGAAVRTGLADAVARGAVAVAFCDADGEYDPAELERLIAPILRGEADYVVGSRFAGTIEWMRPHRRLGNVVLTRALRFVARARITDGQSGYRALSARAAAAAEVVHDYNYAQVLTLDLLAKGFRYAEVPITYRFRSTGRSFVTLGRYLRRVLPAVHRELNDAGGGPSILDDVPREAVPRALPSGLVEATARS